MAERATSRSIDGQLDLHGFTLPEAVAADPTAALEGHIRSLDGVGLPQGTVILLDAETGAPFALGQTGADALYHVPVPADRDFVLMVEAPGHLFHSERVESGSIQGRRARDFRLEPLAADAEVVLRNVFCESGSAVLSTACTGIKEVAVWLAGNPQARLEVGGHTTTWAKPG